jgi:hypothetical protein
MNSRVALCLAGQYRTFDSEVVQKTIKHFLLDKYDCDIYISTWKNRGVSLNHGDKVEYKNEFDTINENDITKYIDCRSIEIEDYNLWYSNLSDTFKYFISNSNLHNGTIPQLYKKYKSYSLIPKEQEYDFIIVTRPDIFIFNHFNIFDMIENNTIWNCNPEGTWAYYPNRIFDILYMGKRDSIDKISNCYFNVLELLDDPYNSNLSSLDCCKILYTYAKKYCGLEVKSTNNLLCNVYRDIDSLDYNLNNCNINSESFKQILKL